MYFIKKNLVSLDAKDLQKENGVNAFQDGEGKTVKIVQLQLLLTITVL